MMNDIVSLETEIRKLRPTILCRLAELLSPNLWKTAMGNIKKPGSQNVPMFTSEHIAMIETAATKQCRSASAIFLDEWGTMGRERPTIQTTINLLVETELFRAADYLAVDVMKGIAPNRPTVGPAAAIEIPVEIASGYNHDEHSSVFPDYSSTDIGVTEGLFSESSSKNDVDLPNYPKEMESSELPLCLNDRAVMSSYEKSSTGVDHSITTTSSLSPSTDISDAHVNDTLPKIFVDYNELPLTVVELCKNRM